MNSKYIFCDRWTFQTLCCYKYKTNCGLCPNSIVCEKYVKTKNEYNLKPVKYAMLKTLEKIGKPRGEENDTRDE
jgi:hypothetical protein